MNVELLQQIKAQILAEPDAFRMDTWSCGTAHCIAGWAVLLSGHQIVNPDAAPYEQKIEDGRYPRDVAIEALGLDARRDEDDLFYADHWPHKFAVRHVNAETRAELAQIAAERIDHFIATKGAE